MSHKDPEKRRAYDRARREQNKPGQAAWRAKNREHLLKRGAQRRLDKRAQCLIGAARTRAKRLGVPFDLDNFEPELQQRIDVGFCELTGFVLDLSPGKRKPNSPSLDRIKPELGYVPSNVRVVCCAINGALGDWGEEGLLPIVQTWMHKLDRRVI